MRKYRPLFGYIVFGLIAIGILSRLVNNPGPFLIPLLVFGIVILLYKYPPTRYRKRSGPRKQAGTASKKNKTDRPKFRVIRGNKRDNDDPPPYH